MAYKLQKVGDDFKLLKRGDDYVLYNDGVSSSTDYSEVTLSNLDPVLLIQPMKDKAQGLFLTQEPYLQTLHSFMLTVITIIM